MKEMIPFDPAEREIFKSICIVPGPAVAVAYLAAFETYFVDGAHMKDAQGETKFDNAQLLIVEMKSSIVKDEKTKNLPLAMCVCLSESLDEYAFTYYTLGKAGVNLNKKSVNILHDRGKAVIRSREVILPLADSFCCNQHLIRNVQGLPGVGKFDDALRSAFIAMTAAYNPSDFEQKRTVLLAGLPENAKAYVMELDPSHINAYYFRERTGKAISFLNTNPVEEENQIEVWARWASIQWKL
jgi:hypothetical protein